MYCPRRHRVAIAGLLCRSWRERPCLRGFKRPYPRSTVVEIHGQNREFLNMPGLSAKHIHTDPGLPFCRYPDQAHSQPSTLAKRVARRTGLAENPRFFEQGPGKRWLKGPPRIPGPAVPAK